jgi:hypothetical protein
VDLDEIEDLIRRYLSAGIAVVLLLVAPGGGGETAPRSDPVVVTVAPSEDAPGTLPPRPGEEDGDEEEDPEASTAPRTTAPRTPAPSTPAPTTPAGTTAPRTAAPTPRTTPPAPTPTRTGTTTDPDTGTAAALLDWGSPTREDDFTAGLAQWDLYEGTGHAGQGVRSPMNATVQDGVLTLTGDASGTTAGTCWGRGRRFGRWEARIRAPESDPSYDAVLLLWPDDDAPGGGEIDIAEMQDPSRRTTGFHLHHGADDEQVEGRVEVDATRWHSWAVEWTPQEITAYVDGRPWFRTTDVATFPPGPMHLCVQLDWFPSGDGPVRESSMQVDRVREYGPDGEAGDEPR